MRKEDEGLGEDVEEPGTSPPPYHYVSVKGRSVDKIFLFRSSAPRPLPPANATYYQTPAVC